MLSNNSRRSGGLQMTTFDFSEIGDILPMHSHGEDDAHVTFVRRGSIRVHGPVMGVMELKAGAFVDWPAGIEHEYVALEAGTRITNIVKKMSHAS
jgi:quercetin dioxygenase-like cupin family protein